MPGRRTARHIVSDSSHRTFVGVGAVSDQSRFGKFGVRVCWGFKYVAKTGIGAEALLAVESTEPKEA